MLRKRLLVAVLMVSITALGQGFKKNSFNAETNGIASAHITYMRTKPLHKDVYFNYGGGYILGVGFGYGSQGIQLESGFLFFGPKHFIETNLAILTGFDEAVSGAVKFAYRYQAPKGFIFKTNLYFTSNTDPHVVPTLGFGWAF